MNINPITSAPSFQGHSRQIQTQISRVIRNPEDTNLNRELAETIKKGAASIFRPEKFMLCTELPESMQQEFPANQK